MDGFGRYKIVVSVGRNFGFGYCEGEEPAPYMDMGNHTRKWQGPCKLNMKVYVIGAHADEDIPVQLTKDCSHSASRSIHSKAIFACMKFKICSYSKTNTRIVVA